MFREANQVLILIVLAVAAFALPQPAAAQTVSSGPIPLPTPVVLQPTQTFGMVGLAPGQTAQLNVLNPSVPAPVAIAATCTAQLSFLDSAGNVLKTESVNVLPGQSTPYTLNRDSDVPGSSPVESLNRVEIRATIQAPPPSSVSSTSTAQPGVVIANLCTLIPTLEVFDNATGKTELVLGSVQPVITGRVGILASPMPASR